MHPPHHPHEDDVPPFADQPAPASDGTAPLPVPGEAARLKSFIRGIPDGGEDGRPSQEGSDTELTVLGQTDAEQREQDFLWRISANPADEHLRQVYADWLEEEQDQYYRAEAIRRGCEAAAVLGRKFVHDPLDVERLLRIRFTEQELEWFAAHPIPAEALEQCKNGNYILVAVSPFTVREIITRHPAKLREQSPVAIYDREDLDKLDDEQKVRSGWLLLRTTPVPNSLNRSLKEQLQLLHNESLPELGEVCYAHLVHYLATGDNILEEDFVRCQDKNGGSGQAAIVGGFGSPRFHITSWNEHESLKNVGIGSCVRG